MTVSSPGCHHLLAPISQHARNLARKHIQSPSETPWKLHYRNRAENCKQNHNLSPRPKIRHEQRPPNQERTRAKATVMTGTMMVLQRQREYPIVTFTALNYQTELLNKTQRKEMIQETSRTRPSQHHFLNLFSNEILAFQGSLAAKDCHVTHFWQRK